MMLLTSGQKSLSERLPPDHIYVASQGADILTMAKEVHASLSDGEYKFGIARPAANGIFLGYRVTEIYGVYIYFDYFQAKIIGIKCNNGAWSQV